MWKWWLAVYLFLTIGALVTFAVGLLRADDGQRYLIFVGLGIFVAVVLFDGCCIPARDRALDKVLFCGRDPSASSSARKAKVGPTTTVASAVPDDATVDLSALALVRAS